MTDVNVSNGFQAEEAWIEAERACFNYVCDAVGYKNGLNAFIGDSIPDNKANLFAFSIYGGPEQVMAKQCPRPQKSFVSTAALVAQFKDRVDAQRFAGRLINQLPAFDDPEKRTGRSGQDQISLQPNVAIFELDTHPSMESRVIELDGSDKVVQFWLLRMDFTIVYTNYFVGDSN